MTRDEMIKRVKSAETLRWVKADGEMPRLVRLNDGTYVSHFLLVLEETGLFEIGQYVIRTNEKGEVVDYGIEFPHWERLRKLTEVVAWAELPLVPGIND